MESNDKNPIAIVTKQALSKAGYLFTPEDDYWQLDKNTNIFVCSLRGLLDDKVEKGFFNTLIYYAVNLSASHVQNIFYRFLHFLRVTDCSQVTDSTLINYRSKLTRDTEWYLGTIRGFLRKWHDLGYEGISDDVIGLLDGWTIKGNIKGDVIKRLDPVKGPLSEHRLNCVTTNHLAPYVELLSLSAQRMNYITLKTRSFWMI